MFLSFSPISRNPPLQTQEFSITVLLYNSLTPLLQFLSQCLDNLMYFNLWGPILYLKVRLSILTAIGSTNSASSGGVISVLTDCRCSSCAKVWSYCGPSYFLTSWQSWRDLWESGMHLWVILEKFGQSVGSSLALITKLPHSFLYLDLPPLLVCSVELSKLAGVFCWTEWHYVCSQI